jgi:transcriptional regulator with XRE-family HTH domain
MPGTVALKGYPSQCERLGDYIRKARIDRGLWHSHVAEIVGVNECSINNWEQGHTEPELRYIPSILVFLGFNPRPMPSDTLEKLEWYKWKMGLNYEELGKEMGIHPEQLMDWIAGRRKPFRKSLEKIGEFLKSV